MSLSSEPPTPHKRLSTAKSPNIDRKTSGASHAKNKRKYLGRRKKEVASESEDSEDNESLESEQTDSLESKSAKQKGKDKHRRQNDWEIIEGLRDGQKFDEKPEKYEGFMMKRRKWPMKGWHKRYFVLENGNVTYAKSPNDIQKGKFHGLVDIGLSVLTFKRDGRRIDIDADDTIYHLKVKSSAMLDEWLLQLRQHRLYRQHELAYGTSAAPRLTDVSTPVEDLTPITSPVSPSGTLTDQRHGHGHRGSFKSRNLSMLERSQSKVAAWLMDTAGIEQTNKELKAAQAQIFELGQTLEKLYQCSLEDHTTGPDPMFEASLGSTVRSEVGSLEVPDRIHISSSNPNLVSHHDSERQRPTSLPETWVSSSGLATHMQELKIRQDFLITAKSVHDTLRGLTRSITTERERLKVALEAEKGSTIQVNANYVTSLKQALSEALKQNTDYRNRLNRIHSESAVSGASPTVEEHPLLTTTSSWESTSVSEFYDAAEYMVSSEATSDISDEEEISSDISDTENTAAQSSDDGLQMKDLQTGRRSKLPVPRPDVDISLWSLLCKNIGKDLSKISMPVTLNEPISMLQRLCEELEYSELLDKIAETEDPYQRMVLVAAFSVSPYASTYYRAGQKPFNPLLGETYECIREDKGWRFIAEQVSHHPPVSACYCDSKNFIFWQDIRIKTKFWGKSMEIQPIGAVKLEIPRYKDHYRWNKVTTCVHNILGGQRWVDHYGEVVIKNHNNGITCKLTYAKSSYWSEKRHEVYGSVTSPEGKVVHHIFGKWNEGIYFGHAPSAKCVWRPGSMPDDHEMYYGFTRFAIELNDIDKEQVHLYAPTDTRFRPDQRLLEEGKIQDAEGEKLRVEQTQRERRKRRDDEKATYSPRWFMKDEEDRREMYRYTGKYWELRKDPGFVSMSLPKLW